MPTGFAGRETSHNSGPFNEKNREGGGKWQAKFPHTWQIKRTHPEKKTISPSSLKFCMIRRPGKRHAHDARACPTML
jgi:hypothetical protein